MENARLKRYSNKRKITEPNHLNINLITENQIKNILIDWIGFKCAKQFAKCYHSTSIDFTRSLCRKIRKMYFVPVCHLQWLSHLVWLLLPAVFVPLLQILRDEQCAIWCACANDLCDRILFCEFKREKKNENYAQFYAVFEKFHYLFRILGIRVSSLPNESLYAT